MKSINQYIKESAKDGKNGHWEEFVDEDTGELITLWREDKPAEIVKAVKEATPEELQKLKDLRKAFDKIDDEWWSVTDELFYAKEELKSLKSELRELQYGMEDEIGQATTDEERDTLGNKYGKELEDVQDQIREKIANIEKLSKKKAELKHKVDDASDKLYDYENELGYHAHSGGKLTKYA